MLDWIYPRLCELCHCPAEYELCEACAARLPQVPLPICLYCGAPVPGGMADPHSCPECSGRMRSFDFARSALMRSDDTLNLVYRLKYHRANYLAAALGRILSRLWDDTPQLSTAEKWSLVPVPSGRDHLFRRGFNQAAELAHALGKLRGLPVLEPLERRPTLVDSQTRLSAAERRRNALQAYAARLSWCAGKHSAPENVVLVDDVYTTGSTARACARALKQIPGVRRVGVLTLLRAMRA